MNTKIKLFAIAISFLGTENLFAQTDTTAIYRITLNDDSELLGKIKSESDRNF